MPISEIESKKAEKFLSKYCKSRTNPSMIDQLEIVYRIEDKLAFISERRPVWNDPTAKNDFDVARFKFSVKNRNWTLYWSDRNSIWREFDEVRPNKELSAFFDIIDSHPIFYG